MRLHLPLAALVLACAWTSHIPASAKGFDRSAPVQLHCPAGVRYEGRLAVAEGSVTIASGDTTLYCDFAQYDKETGTILVSGNVRLFRDGVVLSGDRAIYNIESHSFTGSDFRTASGPFLAETHSVNSLESGVYEATQAFFTTDDVASPSFSLRAENVRFYQDDYTEYRNVTLYAGRVPILWLPYLYQPAKQEQSLSLIPGSRGMWGAFLLTRFAFPVDQNTLGAFRLDYMSKRGLGTGVDLSWTDPATTGWGRFRSYYVDDQAPGTSLVESVSNPQDLPTSRYRLSVQDRTYLSDTLYTTTNLNLLSDVNFLRDFSPSEMRSDPNPDSVFALTKWDEDYTLTLQARAQLNRDFDGSGKSPELALELKRQPFLDTGVFYEGETSVGRLRRRFGRTNGLFDFDTIREDSFHQWSYPKTLGGWLSVVPRGGARLTHYGRSVFDTSLREGDPLYANGGSLTRLVFHTGIEASFKLSRTFDSVGNRTLGLDGLRHIVQPFTDLSLVSSNQDSARLLPFDRLTPNTKLPAIDFPQFNTVDSITDWQVLRLGVRNRLQTRRDDQTLNWLDVETFFDTYLQRPALFPGLQPDDGTFSNVFNRLRWNPLPWLNMTVNSHLPLLDRGFSEFDSQTSFQVSRDVTLQLGNRYLSGNNLIADSKLVSGGARVRLNDNWAFGFLNSYDFATKLAESQQYSIDRDLRSWIASFVFVVREQETRKDIAVLLSLSLKDIPKVSIPLKYDSAAISGAGSGKNR
ncbi:MAG: hypothetical protein RLZZ244_1906 [Verrucomicrobiota bacterium]